MKKDDFIFDGFEPANTTPVPDVLFDELLAILSGAELKVLLYIIRRTAGFKKPTDAISLTQFERGITTKAGKVLDRGCGLNRETICQALQCLENRGCIRLTKRTGSKNDKDVTIYRIRFRGDTAVVGKTDYVLVGQSEKPTTLVGKTDYPSRKNPLGVVGKTDLQDTVRQDTVRQETVRQEGERVVASAPTAPTFPEPEYHCAGTKQQHLVWNCHTWCAANHATCEDYVAAIDAGLHERPTDKVPIVPPGSVTPVTYSQPVYKQGDTDGLHTNTAGHHSRDVSGRGDQSHQNRGDPGQSHTIPSRTLAEQGIADGHLSQPARADVAGAAPERVVGGTDEAPIDGQLTPIQQTVSVNPTDGAVSTASPRSGPRASGKRNGKAHVEPPVPIPIEAVSILDDWDSLFKKPIARTEKHVQAAVDLVPCHPSKDDLKACKGWLFTTDNPQKPWFKKIGVKLRDVADNFGAWQSVAPSEPAEDELEPYSIPWFLARQARRQEQELQA